MTRSESAGYKNFFDVLPAVNFGLSLLIVMHHSCTINIDCTPQQKNLAWIVQRYLYNFSECAVPVFFFISAMLFFRNYENSKAGYCNKVKRRIRSLVIPYIAFNTLGYFKHLLFSNDAYSTAGLIKSILSSDTMPLWFLRELFVLVLLAPIINIFRKNKCFILMICVCIGALVTIGMVKYRSFLYWVPIYTLGASFQESAFADIKTKITCNKFLLLAVFYLIFVWMLPNTTGVMSVNGNLCFYVFRLTSVAMGILAISFLLYSNIKTYGFMHYSFWVYCTHFPLISLLLLMFSHIVKADSQFVEILKYFSVVILSYGLSVNLAIFIQRFCPIIWKILNGGRR